MEQNKGEACIVKLFEELNKNNIEYVLLRGIEKISSNDTVGDLDILVSKKHSKRFKKILYANFWRKNYKVFSSMPNREFYLYHGEIKLDIIIDKVEQIYVSKRLARYKLAEELLRDSRIVNGVKVPSIRQQLILILLRMVYDEKLSPKYFNQLSVKFESYLKEVENKDIKLAKLVESFIQEDGRYVDILEWFKEVNYLEYSYVREVVYKELFSLQNSTYKFYKIIQSFIKNMKVIFRNLFHNRNICIVGIDGTGKSTTIELLNNMIPNSYIKYMGQREWETKLAKKWYDKKHSHDFKVVHLIELLICAIDHRYRILKCLKYDGVVIFDRYIYDDCLGASRLSSVCCKPLFEFFTCKPKYFFYLHCDADTSFKRKGDINNKVEFLKMKALYDEFYMTKNYIISLNTDKLDKNLVAERIFKNIQKDYEEKGGERI